MADKMIIGNYKEFIIFQNKEESLEITLQIGTYGTQDIIYEYDGCWFYGHTKEDGCTLKRN